MYPEFAYLAAVVESSTDAIITKDLFGIIRTWNSAAERIFGYTAEEAVGKRVLLIIPPERHQEEKMILSRLRAGERVEHFQTIRRRKDGTLIHIDVTVSPVRINGTIVGASKIARDITQQKQAERKAAETQARLAVTLASIGDAVVATDTDTRVTFINTVAEELLRYPASEVIGRPLEDVFRIVNHNTRRPVDSPVRQVLQKGTIVEVANHTVLLRPDGTEIPIDDSAAPILDPDGVLLGVVLVFRDVTNRNRAFRQASVLSAIVKSSDDAILSKDLQGTVTSWNRGAERMFGYTAEEMVGSSILKLIPSDRQSEETAIIDSLLRKERVDHYETVRQTKSGQLRDVSVTVSPLLDDEGRVVGASKIARDVTEQKQARLLLHESQERLRITLESIGDAVVATDASARVTFVNSVATNLMGRSTKDLLGESLEDVFHIVNEETRRLVDSPVQRVLREGIVVGLANHTVLIRPDGTEVPIDDSAAPILDADGRLMGVVLVFRDITERKEAEARIHRWNAELETRVKDRTRDLVRSQEQLRRLASQLAVTEQRERRRLATNLHDSLAQLLALGRMKTGTLKQLIPPQSLQTNAIVHELDEMLQKSLRFTRTVMSELSPTVLHDVGLTAALEWLAKEMAQQELEVSVHTNVDEEIRLPDTHGELLFQCIRELLINVRKHAGVNQASISISRQDTQTVVVIVQDYGSGFDVSHTQSASSDEHFGLFSIRERMAALGGWCLIDSQPGRGTKVELGLGEQSKVVPEGMSLEEATMALSQGPESRRSWRILLVDDHAMVRQGLRKILETYTDVEVVAEASNGEEAIRRAMELQPHAVVMDINMPKINGIEATRQIKQHFPAMAVIGLSVQTTEETLDAMRAAGASVVLSKEQASGQLYEAIAFFLNRTS
jgi:PAS domain S-box-containing protein